MSSLRLDGSQIVKNKGFHNMLQKDIAAQAYKQIQTVSKSIPVPPSVAKRVLLN
jgi:hypothetical protein